MRVGVSLALLGMLLPAQPAAAQGAPPSVEEGRGRVVAVDDIPVDDAGRLRPDLLPGATLPAPAPADVRERLSELTELRERARGGRRGLVAPRRIGDLPGEMPPRMDSGDPNPDGLLYDVPSAGN